MDSILNQLPPMKTGNDLLSALAVLPPYGESIRSESPSSRLIALSEIYNIYIPSHMSVEIYSKLYLALLRSLQKKTTRNTQVQHNENHKMIIQKEHNVILGGSDSFTITGCSGIGKSRSINRALDLITEKGVLKISYPITSIIPCVVVQCPFDSSVKGLLIEILRKVDMVLGSDYYDKALRTRVTTDMLIGSVSQVSLNHIGLLVVDEIQNVVNSKNGKSLIGMLTQLINNSGISICMVGTPESTAFFEQAIQLARRSLGLQYGAIEYNPYFHDFCCTLFRYQYTRNITEITPAIIQWLYEHSAGIVSNVISLIHDAQEIAILNGTEILDMESLNEAYKKRLSMLHGYIEPSITRKRQITPKIDTAESYAEDPVPPAPDTPSIADIAAMAKEKSLEIVGLLQEHMTVEVIQI